MNRAWTLNEFIYTMRFHFFEVNFDYTSNRATIQVDIYEFKNLLPPIPMILGKIKSLNSQVTASIKRHGF